MKSLSFKRLSPTAVLPTRGTPCSIGLDLYADANVLLGPGERCAVPTGVAVAIPDGYYGRVAPRSGHALKRGLDVLAGVIDEDWRGPVAVLLINFGSELVSITKGDRIAQLITERADKLEPEWADELPDTQRGENGWGSTGV